MNYSRQICCSWCNLYAPSAKAALLARMYDARVHSSTGCSCSGRPFESARRCQGWRQVQTPQQLSQPFYYKVPAVKSTLRQAASTGIYQQWHTSSRVTRQNSRTKHTLSMTSCQVSSLASARSLSIALVPNSGKEVDETPCTGHCF